MNYTEEQKQNILSIYSSIEEHEALKSIRDAEQYLESTDYIANKIVEYQFLGKEMDKDYTEILNKREEAREVIRQYTEGDK